MKLFFTDIFELPLPDGHRFPMRKYRMLRERVADLGELTVPDAATDEQLLRAHDADYLRRVTTGDLTPLEVRRIGFPWSAGLVERSRRSAGATIAACHAALIDGVGINLAGGTHHAGPDWGQGYCVFNDSAVAARALGGHRVLIVDCDVHQGNGTAAILRNDPDHFTFSIHGAKNFPFRKEESDLDLELPDGAGDDEYVDLLAASLDQAIGRARADLVIYLSGADAHVGDTLGRLALTKEGLRRRDELVFRYCREAGLPVAVTMGGGYGRNVEDTVDIHFATVQEAGRNR